jgi:hypothetical protein
MYPYDIISEKRFRAYRMWWVPGDITEKVSKAEHTGRECMAGFVRV